jgi:hypothetical protein
MALFAVMHMRVFSHTEFLPDGAIMARFARNEEGAPINVRTDTSWGRVCERARDVLTVSDVIEDAQRNFSVAYSSYMMQGIDGGIVGEGDAERITRQAERERALRAREEAAKERAEAAARARKSNRWGVTSMRSASRSKSSTTCSTCAASRATSRRRPKTSRTAR